MNGSSTLIIETPERSIRTPLEGEAGEFDGMLDVKV